MIGRSLFLLTLLQAEVSGQLWPADNPGDVTAQNGRRMAAQIPCHYTYPPTQRIKDRMGIWYNSEQQSRDASVAFHSGNPSLESTKFHHRTRLSGNLRAKDCSLVIDNVTQDDDGPYFFRVEFAEGWRVNYHPVTRLHVIAFTDKPMIFPAKMVAGQPVNVTCSFNTTCDGTTPNLTWVTPADIPSSASHSKTQRGDTLTYTSVLSLTPAPKHHGQDLTCKVRYPTVSSKQKLTLTVQYAPQNLSITSPNNMNSSWVSVKEGNSAAILCSVQSLPASNLTWQHLGVTLNTTRSSSELWMEFPQLALRDAGVYQCVAQNEHGTTERDVTLTVEYAPQNLSITSPNNMNSSGVSVKEGNSAAFHCSVQSLPASNLTWRHLGVTLNTTRSSNELWMEFPQLAPRDAGVYQCVAQNEHGTTERDVTLTVEYAPQNISITSPSNVNNSGVSVKEGNSAAILCSVQSFPASNLTWRHHGVKLSTTRSSNELWLKILRVTQRDAGSYQCVAENEYGKEEGTVTLVVEYGPVILPDSGCSRTPESVTCVCAAWCNPPGELTWRLPQANFSGNQTFGHFQTWQVAGGHLVNSTLTLRGREGVDVTALCTVRSRHGEAMLMVYLSMEICGCDRTGKYVMAMIVLAVVITAAIFWAARCRGKRGQRRSGKCPNVFTGIYS
ncbi:LOW QUALITY PROTEIN: myelin-associated glycoprotein-like [Rhinoraja longicauda]